MILKLSHTYTAMKHIFDVRYVRNTHLSAKTLMNEMDNKKVFENMIHFLAYQGDMKEMESILNIGVRKYGVDVGINQLLELRLDISRAEESLKYAVINSACFSHSLTKFRNITRMFMLNLFLMLLKDSMDY